MLRTKFLGRHAASIENSDLRVTVLEEGGHIAEIFHKKTGVNPLWVPPWSSQERPDCGDGVDANLLAGIMGHNVCVDLFGVPSEAEAAAGIGVHGEASVRRYEIEEDAGRLAMRVRMPLAGLLFERHLALEGETV